MGSNRVRTVEVLNGREVVAANVVGVNISHARRVARPDSGPGSGPFGEERIHGAGSSSLGHDGVRLRTGCQKSGYGHTAEAAQRGSSGQTSGGRRRCWARGGD